MMCFHLSYVAHINEGTADTIFCHYTFTQVSELKTENKTKDVLTVSAFKTKKEYKDL
jgi:hypothetical protein